MNKSRKNAGGLSDHGRLLELEPFTAKMPVSDEEIVYLRRCKCTEAVLELGFDKASRARVQVRVIATRVKWLNM